MKTIGLETLVPKIVNCINKDCNQEIVRVQVFDFKRYAFLYFNCNTHKKISTCPGCGMDLYKSCPEQPFDSSKGNEEICDSCLDFCKHAPV